MSEPTRLAGSNEPHADTDPASAVGSTTDPQGAAAELLLLLKTTGKDRQQDWDERVSRLVSRLAADFLTQKDDDLALTEAALVAWAAGEGSQAARKKQLKLARWAEVQPPSIPREFASEAGQLAIFRALAGVGQHWAAAYVCQVWPVLASDKVKTEALGWLLKQSHSAADLFDRLRTDFTVLEPEAATDILTRLAKLAAKADWPSQIPRGRHTIEALAKLSGAALTKPDIASTKSLDTLRQALLDLAYVCVRADPPQVFSGPFSALVDRLARSLDDGKRKPTGGALDRIASIACSQAELVCEVLESPEPSREAATRLLTALSKHVKQANWPVLDATRRSAEGLESQVVALLVAWDDLVSEPERSTEFGSALLQFAHELSIERLERLGEILTFRDDMHQLVHKDDEAASPIRGVRVLRHGYVRRRSDGSVVVLMKALVERFNGV